MQGYIQNVLQLNILYICYADVEQITQIWNPSALTSLQHLQPDWQLRNYRIGQGEMLGSGPAQNSWAHPAAFQAFAKAVIPNYAPIHLERIYCQITQAGRFQAKGKPYGK